MGAGTVIDQDNRRIGVYGVAITNGTVLLARVAAGYQAAGLWTLPGGAADWGETPEEALARELHEETGLAVTDSRPLLVDSVVAPPDRSVELHLLSLVYEVEVAGEVRPEARGSTDGAAWHSLDALPTLGSLAERVLRR